MRFVVRLTDGVLDDIAALYEWIVREGAPVTARRWTQDLMRALASLETFPRRHPMAREAALFEQVVLRQMVHGSIRVLYVVREREVVVLHARHASRQDLGPVDLAGWPEDVREGQLALVHTTV